jgi:polyisoprenoid-binding protein YceI
MSIFTRNRSTAETDSFDDATTAVSDIAGDYTIDASHSRLGFSARHAMVTTVRGAFPKFEGAAHIDTANPTASTVTLTIDVSGVDTGSADRDGHLRSADFFDVENYPTMTFASTKVEREDASTWLITGDLTIKDVTKPVTIEFESTGSARDPFGNLRVGFEGATSINRKDWGLVWNAALETGGVLVSEKIKLEFDVSAIQNG